MDKKITPKIYLTAAIIALALNVISIALSYLAAVAYSDVVYADWLYTLLAFSADLFTATRLLFAFSAVTFAAYRLTSRASVGVGIALGIASLIGVALRLAVNLFSTPDSAVAHIIISVLELFTELVFIAAAVAISCLMAKKYARLEKSGGKTKGFGVKVAALCARLPVFAVQLVSEIGNIIGFFAEYSDPTSAEIASMVWGVASVVLLFFILGYPVFSVTAALLSRVLGKNKKNGSPKTAKA